MMFVLLLTVLLAQADPVREAQLLVQQGRSLEALQLLEDASRAEPEDATIHHALGALYASGGRGREALAAIERAVELEPDNPDYAFAHGEILYRAGRYQEALAPLEKASDLPDALMLLAAVYEKLGPKEKMFETLSRYLETRPEDRSARLLLGQQLEAAKRYDEALTVYRGGGDDPVLSYHAADVLARSRVTYGEAEALVTRALEAEPDMLEAGLLLARLHDRQGRHQEGLAELERLRELHPDAPQVHYQLATAYQRAGATEKAEAAAARFQELSAQEKEASDREARVAVTYKKAADLLQQGKMLEAEPIFRSVLEIDPGHALTMSMLAKIAYSKGDLTTAQERIAQALARDDEVAEYHYLNALFAIQAGSPETALSSVRRSLELDPAFADAWSMLGSLLLDSGRAAESVDCFLKAAALEPSNAAVQLNLASAYAALGNDDAEQAAMDRYRELSSR